MSFLIDTNVISEPRRPQPDPRVLSWFNQTDRGAVFISALTLGELVSGATKALRRNPTAGMRLKSWVDEVQADYADRVIDIDRDIAVRWGELASLRTIPVVDCLLAATALVHGMTLVTRNVRDIADTGVTLLNPWDA